jgi:hypothetical protein
MIATAKRPASVATDGAERVGKPDAYFAAIQIPRPGLNSRRKLCGGFPARSSQRSSRTRG